RCARASWKWSRWQGCWRRRSAADGGHRVAQCLRVGAADEALAQLALVVEDEGAWKGPVPRRLAQRPRHRIRLRGIEQDGARMRETVMRQHLLRLLPVLRAIDAHQDDG